MLIHWWWIPLLATALLGSLLVVQATPFGVGLVNDSVGYIGGARNILAGSGYSRLVGDGTTRPVTNYPPFYSLVLAGFGLYGLNAIVAARWLNAFLFGVNILLVGGFSWRISGSRLTGIGAALFFTISEPILWTHSVAMSEPLYLTINLLIFGCLAATYEVRRPWLLSAGFLTGLAYLTRYVGISIFIVCVLGILVVRQERMTRVRAAAQFLLAGFPLPVMWILRNYHVTGNTGNRLLVYHPIPMDKWEEGTRNVASWILPETFGLVDRLLPLWGIILVVLLLAISAAATWICWQSFQGRKIIDNHQQFLALLFLLQAGIYPMVLLFTLTFVDASPIFEHRILSPWYLCCIVLGSIGFTWLWRKQGWIGKIGLTAILFGAAVSLSRDCSNALMDLQRDGVGFAGSRWRESETIQATGSLPAGVHLFSNKPTGIYIITGRPAYILPSPDNPATDMPREGYLDGLIYMKKQVNEGRAAAVIFDYSELLADPQNSDWIKEIVRGIPLVREYPDGAIFGRLP